MTAAAGRALGEIIVEKLWKKGKPYASPDATQNHLSPGTPTEPCRAQLKVAVTFVLPAGTRIEHVVPLADGQPDQLVKVCPVFGVAESPMVFPAVNCAIHVTDGQEIPAGALVTEPAPTKVTDTTACEALPPGQRGSAGLFTVIVA